jgi:hypothetical protein
VAVPDVAEVEPGAAGGEGGEPAAGEEAAAAKSEKQAKQADPKEDLGARQLAAMAAAEKLAQSKTAKAEPSPFAAIDFGAYAKRIVSFLGSILRNIISAKNLSDICFSSNFGQISTQKSTHYVLSLGLYAENVSDKCKF